MRILLVDDVQSERMRLAILLKQLGHTVVMAKSGMEALEAYPDFEPDVVLLDISMPDMDGFTVSTRLRQMYSEWVPIIFLSSYHEPSIIAKAIEAGGDDYLIKPVDQVVLESKLMAMQRIASMLRVLKQKTTELAIANEKLERLAQEDGLTRIKNRRFIDSKLREMISTYGRLQLPMSVILLDVDQFKLYNDSYGHVAGDKCLISIAQVLTDLFERSCEVVGRFGGEEFVVLSAHSSKDKLIHDAERIQSRLESLRIPHQNSDVSNIVTVSQGLLYFHPSGDEVTDWVYKRVDKALYKAKLEGRNRYQLAD
ncbi:diguanylate cyclase [Vibrio nereis]|uniref:diguanylate cyclase n=1 Tax=Vibrio nereis TaxID=693 RepID=A0A0M0HS28_VIBNE|nr:diguanylate cyclase [Vibrio nereis]KOO04702.1 diguanylate cyclase [Vibrio nereis]